MTGESNNEHVQTPDALDAKEVHTHPFVSEKSEGKPWFEWCVAGGIAVSALLALFGFLLAATIILALTSLMCATVRLILREKSPWKVRGIFFDCFIGFGFGIGIIGTYISIVMMS